MGFGVIRNPPQAPDGPGDAAHLRREGRAMSADQHPEQAVLDEIVRRIVAVAQPAKIILFGSADRRRTIGESVPRLGGEVDKLGNHLMRCGR